MHGSTHEYQSCVGHNAPRYRLEGAISVKVPQGDKQIVTTNKSTRLRARLSGGAQRVPPTATKRAEVNLLPDDVIQSVRAEHERKLGNHRLTRDQAIAALISMKVSDSAMRVSDSVAPLAQKKTKFSLSD